MIVYLDTSALVKLYVEEDGSDDVAKWVAAARFVATSRVAYPEARAALARRRREGGLTAGALRGAVRDLDRDLGRYVVVELDTAIAASAGDLAERRALRGFDALHLASALSLEAYFRPTPAFVAFDRKLTLAAAAEGLVVEFAVPRDDR